MRATGGEAGRETRRPGPTRESRYAYWMSHASGQANDALLAKILSSRESGGSALPPNLGLEPSEWQAMLSTHFPSAVPLTTPVPLGADELADEARVVERDDLVALLLAGRAGRCASEGWLAIIVAAACMGGDHLWQDLGLWSREDLSRLMNGNFPALAQRNDRDMKWKRFLYRQLCQAEGVYVCRSPSCEVCVDYARCFGAED
ncbi:nitrogen fixation protein NifQ [Acidihalobacter prosperus]|uniref:Nitrogenase FeMo-cofactor synthesis molybdenum delivery protein NifQ n=1 Tax=Acidihalobacter prosperus TaxID=160660 RepID=A0A1A6C7T8_9GAMM|nr:nitrogen fixation protein NifQ [Acidihalobacter prosperus]OBS10621.1 Nitrogenase FeMo-cofactor synthesis molybdenum delivery protein NifQ [Acidihalobacter prosperus]